MAKEPWAWDKQGSPVVEGDFSLDPSKESLLATMLLSPRLSQTELLNLITWGYARCHLLVALPPLQGDSGLTSGQQ